MKDQCKKIFVLHLRPDVSIPCYNIIAACKLSCKISRIKDTLQKISQINLRFYYLTLQHYFFYAHTAYIRIKYSKKGSFEMSTYRQSRTSLIFFKNIFLNKFFLVSTLSSMGGVVCSAIVSERLKIGKSLGIPQQTFVGLEDVFNTSSASQFYVFPDVLKTSYEDVLKTFSRPLARRLEDIFETSSRRLGRRKIVTLKTSSRRLEDMS